jgi:predicted NUDIX family phosphoesterase
VSESELVLGLARTAIPMPLDWRGVAERPFDPLLAAIEASGEFRPRDEVESDATWKQVIPYLVLRDGERLFLMKRTSAGGDARLHERYTIGIGGHVNPEDGGVVGGLMREWNEEIAADFTPDFEPVGLLNDDDNAVGAVHLGLVYAADAAGRPVAIRETHKLSGSFATLTQAAAFADRMETWSALLFDFLERR